MDDEHANLQPQTPFERVNDEAPADAEPFVPPEPAPKNDPVPEED